MIRFALHICLTVMALVASAGESSATDCLVGYGCGDVQLCKDATVLNGSVRTWKPYQSALKTLAKKRGLTCGVGNSVASNTAPLFRKSDFLALNSTKRRQLQYGLKKLGYYTSSIDGLYGPNTQRAVRGYAKAKAITSGYPNSVYNRIISDVNVPASFATAQQSTSSSSSSSSSSSGGSSILGNIFKGLVVAGVCSQTPSAAACLDGAMGKETKRRSTSPSNRTLKSGTWIRSGNTWIGPGGEAIFDYGSVI